MGLVWWPMLEVGSVASTTMLASPPRMAGPLSGVTHCCFRSCCARRRTTRDTAVVGKFHFNPRLREAHPTGGAFGSGFDQQYGFVGGMTDYYDHHPS